MPEKKEQIYELIPKIMADIGHVGKDKKNTFQNYNFRGIDDVYNCVGPVFVKHGVFIVPSVKSVTVTQVNTTTGKPSTQIVMEIAYRFYAPDGSYVEAVTVGEAMDTGDKAANKAMSDAMKYAVWQTFCIPTIGVDSEVDSHEQAPPKPAQPPANPEQPAIDAIKKKMFEIFGKEECIAAKARVIGWDGKFLGCDGVITTLAEAQALEQLLNKGADQ